jgi:hypothetical protein
MYFNGPRPELTGDLPEALHQIKDVSSIAVTQLEALEKNSNRTEIIGILDRLDEVLEIIRQQIKPLSPLIDEFRTAKENIPPGSRAEVFYQTRQCYLDLMTRVNTLSKKGTHYDRQNDRAQLDVTGSDS